MHGLVVLGICHQLEKPCAVTQFDEGDASEVTADGNPSVEGDALPDFGGADVSCPMASFLGGFKQFKRICGVH
jgi:hypothetical protein